MSCRNKFQLSAVECLSSNFRLVSIPDPPPPLRSHFGVGRRTHLRPPTPKWLHTAEAGLRGFNPYALTNCKSTTESAYRRHEREKKCYYEKILEVEHGAFTPLVFSVVGGMGTVATVMYKRLASLLADKHAQSYPKTISWIRCLLNFSLLRLAIMCICGAHSTSNRACHTAVLSEGQLDLVASEGRIPIC